MAELGRGLAIRPRSLRARVTIGAVVVVAVALALGAIAFRSALAHSLRADAENSAEIRVQALAEEVMRQGPEVITRLGDEAAQLVDADGTVLAQSEEAEGETLPRREDPTEVVVDDEPALVVSEDLDDGREILLAFSIEDDEQVSGAVGRLLLVAIPVLVALVAATVRFVVGRALAPVSRIRQEVDAIGADRLDRRVPEGGSGDEIARLAGTMNRMLARLDDSQQAQRRFVSDASHELRSPLATLRQHAELARSHPEVTSAEELSDVVLEEGRRMQAIVEAMLLLARLDEGAPRGAEPVDLDDLVIAEATRVRTTSPRILVDGSAIGAARVAGDARLLGQLIRNLVDNAVRHAAGRVALGVAEVDGTAVLTIDDDGAGIPEAEWERVFERFVRLDEARAREAGGSGLGLAIVRAIARAHDGQVHVEASPSGGARFVVTLPAAA
ncbi:sensor histidine kinase [Aeromicrobium wangtongii]|uniref:sensor histidine kinase n=1 Tax=Aeromicrobium wangtongii TaxID=2969247 RepID=UPI002017E93A|nr:ATP-binding protein [Aeromicrobium wangtongii]MCL3819053.1 HAMP domain-containing histidine kinase [Aeromicrobium wangtongii]